MSTQHTPGPWSFRETGEGHKYAKEWREINPGIVGPASYTTNKWGEPEETIGVRITEANARLIAAAPDLLAELKAITEIIEAAKDSNDGIEALEAFSCNRAHAAIAKATGCASS